MQFWANVAEAGRCHAAQVDPVDDYYRPLTKHERELAYRYGSMPPHGELAGFIRRWEQTVRVAEEGAGVVMRLAAALNVSLAGTAKALEVGDVDGAQTIVRGVREHMHKIGIDRMGMGRLLDFWD